jgi:hypothetical protein
MKRFLSVLLALAASASAMGGTFTVTSQDSSSMAVHYTGTVERWDPMFFRFLVDECGDRVMLMTIDSPGGDAYAGLQLYWLMEAHPRLVTIAGSQLGCWSAAALMWTAGDHKLIEGNGAVWFHAAFCQWDPEPNPDIGCDTADFQHHLIKVLDNAGFHGATFNALLNQLQRDNGTDGWVGITNEGWFTRDTTDWWFKPFNGEIIKR